MVKSAKGRGRIAGTVLLACAMLIALGLHAPARASICTVDLHDKHTVAKQLC